MFAVAAGFYCPFPVRVRRFSLFFLPSLPPSLAPLPPPLPTRAKLLLSLPAPEPQCLKAVMPWYGFRPHLEGEIVVNKDTFYEACNAINTAVPGDLENSLSFRLLGDPALAWLGLMVCQVTLMTIEIGLVYSNAEWQLFGTMLLSSVYTGYLLLTSQGVFLNTYYAGGAGAAEAGSLKGENLPSPAWNAKAGL